MSTCTFDGCGHPVHAKAKRSGLCDRHYMQKIRRRPMTPHPAPTAQGRLWQRLSAGDPDACWEFSGPRDRDGYGQVAFDGRQYKAHRLAWEAANGPIPAGMVVCHRCDNPPCCNPEHLFTGTAAENTADMDNKGRRGSPNKVTEDDVRVIRRLASEGATLASLAMRFGVSDSNIQFIVHRRTWKHVA